MKTLLLAAPAAAQNVPCLVADVNPSGDSSPVGITVVGNQLFFDADDGTNGRQLWVSDGTAAGTFRLTDTGATVSYLFEFEDRLCFSGEDQLWRSDGTIAGTGLFKQLAAKAPAVGDLVQIQCWFRDPLNPSNQTTSLSDALEFTLCP